MAHPYYPPGDDREHVRPAQPIESIFARDGRERKCRALISYFDRWASASGINPFEHAGAIADLLSNASTTAWDAFASDAHVKPASAQSRAVIISEYRERARVTASARIGRKR